MKRKSTSSILKDEPGAIDLIRQAPENERKRNKKQCNSIDQNVEPQEKQRDGSSGSRDKHGTGKKRKRGKSSAPSKRRKLRKKKAGGVADGIETSVESDDYISQLPEDIIHHILSLIRCRKSAVRTSVLSKRWMDIWTTFSVLTFDQRKFMISDDIQEKRKTELFKDFIDQSLQSHLEKKLNILKFELHLTDYDQKMERGMDHWVVLTTKNNIIKELGLHIHSRGKNVYNFPKKVFVLDTLTGLRLQSCKLDPSCAIKLPHLQKLYLRDCKVDEQSMKNIISSCPLIEDLRLICCKGLKFLQLLDLLKLDRVEVHQCYGLKKIEIKAANLQTFWYCGKNRTSCKLILSGCESLKRLKLEDKKMTDNQFRELFFAFPVLEKMDLSKCQKLKGIRIASHRLNSLVLRDCENLQGVEIDTPNLLSFEYQGNRNQKVPFSFLNPRRLKEVKLSFGSASTGDLKFDHTKDEPTWFETLRHLLGKFDHNRTFKLVVRTMKNVIIYEDLREYSLPSVCGLKLELINSSVETGELLNNTLQKWHPETISIASSSGSKFAKLVHEEMMESKKDPTCCTSKHTNNKCWRHTLKVAKKVNLKRAKGKSSWIAWLKSCPNDLREITCFSLIKKT